MHRKVFSGDIHQTQRLNLLYLKAETQHFSRTLWLSPLRLLPALEWSSWWQRVVFPLPNHRHADILGGKAACSTPPGTRQSPRSGQGWMATTHLLPVRSCWAAAVWRHLAPGRAAPGSLLLPKSRCGERWRRVSLGKAGAVGSWTWHPPQSEPVPCALTLPGERWLRFPNAHRALSPAKGSNVGYAEHIHYFPAWFFVPSWENIDIAAFEDLLSTHFEPAATEARCPSALPYIKHPNLLMGLCKHVLHKYICVCTSTQPHQYLPKLAKPNLLPSLEKPIAEFQSMGFSTWPSAHLEQRWFVRPPL